MKTRRIKLNNGKYAVVSKEDFEWLSEFQWHLSNQGYVVSDRSLTINGQRRMSRAIVQRLAGTKLARHIDIDHQDGDKLNNSRTNLRPATRQENVFNSKPRQGKFSQYKGVGWKADHRKWTARICRDGRLINLGYYDNELDAALAYDCAAIQLFGDFAWLNIIGR